jgi:hypothetical protein
MDIKSLKTLQDSINKGQESTFTPTDAQKLAKSRFWTAMQGEGPTASPTPNLDQALRFGSIDQKWWKLDGFQPWFWNRNEFNEKLEYIGILALEELESTLKSKLVTSAQKIPAIKLALEVSNKLGAKSAAAANLPEKLANMTAQELVQYIEQRKSLLTQPEETDKVPSKLQ